MINRKSPVLWVVLSIAVMAFLILWTVQGRSPSLDTSLTLEHAHSQDKKEEGHILPDPDTDECPSCPAAKLPQDGRAPDEISEKQRICEELLRKAAVDGNPHPNLRGLDGCMGTTPLHVADNSSHVIALLAAGADPNAQDFLGNSPLHAAADRRKNPHVVKVLLKAGANAKLRNRSGNTPLQWMRGRPDRNKLLHSKLLMTIEGLAWKKGVTTEQLIERMPTNFASKLKKLETQTNWESEIENLLTSSP